MHCHRNLPFHPIRSLAAGRSVSPSRLPHGPGFEIHVIEARRAQTRAVLKSRRGKRVGRDLELDCLRDGVDSSAHPLIAEIVVSPAPLGKHRTYHRTGVAATYGFDGRGGGSENGKSHERRSRMFHPRPSRAISPTGFASEDKGGNDTLDGIAAQWEEGHRSEGDRVQATGQHCPKEPAASRVRAELL